MAIDTITKATAKASYLIGLKTTEIASDLDISYDTLIGWIMKEKWKAEKQVKLQELTADLTDKIKITSQDAVNELHKILMKKTSSNSDKIASAKALLDISGLKSQVIEDKRPLPAVIIRSKYGKAEDN